MSAHIVYDTAPLGSLIRYSDGMPRPPARFAKKLAAWEQRNGVGRLVRREPPRERPTHRTQAAIILDEGNFATGNVVLVTVLRQHLLDNELRYEIVQRPAIGMIRVLLPIGDNLELLHLAASREAAELWLAKTRHDRARLEEVTADEVCADFIEGRVAALRDPDAPKEI
ncbi:hypothetical protein [Mesorhizobium sp. B1-1-8]|uniref:hypothetical protein n=1 Tax=Mesorhizobium sp. B1-1-8 TaxID=2589976 RepID=UPI00112CA547|nr:hypothetical protein [Mesorhizobium sp. B1-1-8]UCI09484.1 hypothetical protein FJ974_10690 [Mesorhizobium sp. B1-1-8]